MSFILFSLVFASAVSVFTIAVFTFRWCLASSPGRLSPIDVGDFNVVDIYKSLPRETILKIPTKLNLGYNLLLFNVTGGLNIGMCIRTAMLHGVSKVYIVGRRQYDRRSTVGAEKYLTIEKLRYVDDWPEFFSSRGLIPVSVEQNGTNVDKAMGAVAAATGTICFVMGAESYGVPKEILDISRCVLTIPQTGILRSHNVATACSIVLSAYATQMRKRVVDRLDLAE